jgi:hypothetical protein
MTVNVIDLTRAALGTALVLAMTACGSGKPVPPTNGGIADSAASAAATMPPAKSSSKAASAP